MVPQSLNLFVVRNASLTGMHENEILHLNLDGINTVDFIPRASQQI